MNKLLFVLVSFLIPLGGYAQSDSIEIKPLVPLVVIEPEYVDSRYIPPVPSKRIFIELLNEEKIRNCYIFFYSPLMQSPDFSFAQEVGGHNNLIGGISAYDENKAYVHIPQKEFEKPEILIKAIGYELARIDARNLPADTTVQVRLKPRVGHQHIMLGHDGLRQIVRDRQMSKYYYGECKPIYMKDGSHWDVFCYCWGCDLYLNETILKEVLAREPSLLKKIYKHLKKGKPYSILIDVEKSDKGYISTNIKEEYPQKKKYQKLLSNLRGRWLLDTNIEPIKKGQVRLIFEVTSIADDL